MLCFAFITWFVLPISIPLDGIHSSNSWIQSLPLLEWFLSPSNGPISSSSYNSTSFFLRRTVIKQNKFMFYFLYNGMGGIIIWCKLKKCFVLCSFIVFLKMIPTLKKYFLSVGIIFKTIKLHKTKHFRPSVYRSVTVFIPILWFWLFCWFVTRFWNLIFIGVDSCQNKFSMSQQTGFHFVHVWTEPIIPFLICKNVLR